MMFEYYCMNANWSSSFCDHRAVPVSRRLPDPCLVQFPLLKFDNCMGGGSRVSLGSTDLMALRGLKGALSIAREYFDFLEKKGVPM
ncbi:hypothetical protein JCM39068_40230 [Desulfocastanea catecholica]